MKIGIQWLKVVECFCPRNDPVPWHDPEDEHWW